MLWNNFEWASGDVSHHFQAMAWILAGWVFFATIAIVRSHFRHNKLKQELKKAGKQLENTRQELQKLKKEQQWDLHHHHQMMSQM